MSDLNINTGQRSPLGEGQGDNNSANNTGGRSGLGGRRSSMGEGALDSFNTFYRNATEALETYESNPTEGNYSIAHSIIRVIDSRRRAALAAGVSDSDLSYQSTLQARLQNTRLSENLRNQTEEQAIAMSCYKEFYDSATEALKVYADRPIISNYDAAYSIIGKIDRHRRAALAEGVSEMHLSFQSTLEAKLQRIECIEIPQDSPEATEALEAFNTYYREAIEALSTYETDPNQENYRTAHNLITHINQQRNTAFEQGVSNDALAYQSTLESRLQRSQRVDSMRRQAPEAVQAFAVFEGIYAEATQALERYEADTTEENYEAAHELVMAIDGHRQTALAAGVLTSRLKCQSTLQARLVSLHIQSITNEYNTAHIRADQAVSAYISDSSLITEAEANEALDTLLSIHSIVVNSGVAESSLFEVNNLVDRFNTAHHQFQESRFRNDAEALTIQLQGQINDQFNQEINDLDNLELALEEEAVQNLEREETNETSSLSTTSTGPSSRELSSIPYGLNNIEDVLIASTEDAEELAVYQNALSYLRDTNGYNVAFNPSLGGDSSVSALAYLLAKELNNNPEVEESFVGLLLSLRFLPNLIVSDGFTSSRLKTAVEDVQVVLCDDRHHRGSFSWLVDGLLNREVLSTEHANFINSFRTVVAGVIAVDSIESSGHERLRRRPENREWLDRVMIPGQAIEMDIFFKFFKALGIENDLYSILPPDLPSPFSRDRLGASHSTTFLTDPQNYAISLNRERTDEDFSIVRFRDHFIVVGRETLEEATAPIATAESSAHIQERLSRLTREPDPFRVPSENEEANHEVGMIHIPEEEIEQELSIEERRLQIDADRQKIASARARRATLIEETSSDQYDAITRFLVVEGVALDLTDANAIKDKLLGDEFTEATLGERLESFLNKRCRDYSARSGCSSTWGTHALEALRSISHETKVPLGSLLRILRIFAEFNELREIPNSTQEIKQFIKDNIGGLVALSFKDDTYDWIGGRPSYSRYINYDEASWDGQTRDLVWRYFDDNYSENRIHFAREVNGLVRNKINAREADLATLANQGNPSAARSFRTAFSEITTSSSSLYLAFNRVQRLDLNDFPAGSGNRSILEANQVNGVQFEVNTGFIFNDPYLESVQMVPLPSLPSIEDWHTVVSSIVDAFTAHNPVGSTTYNDNIAAIKTQLGNAGNPPGPDWSTWERNGHYRYLYDNLKKRICRIYNEFTKEGLTPEEKRDNLANFALALSGYGTDCPDGTHRKLFNYEQANVFKIPEDAHLGIRISYLFAKDRMHYIDQHQDAAHGGDTEEGLMNYNRLCSNIHHVFGLQGKLSDNSSARAGFRVDNRFPRDNPTRVINRYLYGGAWQQEASPRTEIVHSPDSNISRLVTNRTFMPHTIEAYTVKRMVSLIKEGISNGILQEAQLLKNAKEEPAIFKAYNEIIEDFDGSSNPYFDFVENKIVFKDTVYQALLEKYYFINPTVRTL